MANQSAFDLVAGGKVLIPSFQTTGTATGNPNLNGAVDNFGSGNANIGGAGNMFIFAGPTTAALNPGGTGAEYVVTNFSIPANSFDQPGRGITIQVTGSFGANANAGKLVRIVYNPTGASTVGGTIGLGGGGTAIATSAIGAYNGSAFNLAASIYKYGISGSNTQMGIQTSAVVGNVGQALAVATALTAIEGAVIPLCVTAQSGSAGVTGLATDVAINFIKVEGYN